jgi:predicted flavoprotein YhiN
VKPGRTTRAVLIKDATTSAELIRIWERNNIASYVFKQENLNDALLKFATQTVPQFFDQDSVRRFLNTSGRINSSSPRAAVEIPDALYRRILEREKFLIERFYRKTPHASQVIRT